MLRPSVLVLTVCLSVGASAQEKEFDGDVFAAELNEALEERGVEGVTVVPWNDTGTGEMTGTSMMGNETDDMTASSGETTASVSTEAPSEDIGDAVDTIEGASGFIAGRLCPNPYRPTKLVLHLTAGFNLVFSGETGSQVEWDLEVICNRG